MADKIGDGIEGAFNKFRGEPNSLLDGERLVLIYFAGN